MADKNQPRGKPSASHAWNLQEIQDLIDVLAGRGISEFELEKGGVKIRIKREGARAESPAPPAFADNSFPPQPSVHHNPPPAAPAASTQTPIEPAAESTEGLFLIKSPIVGTFYSAPAPNAPPFVKSGDGVQVGQVLCIIEAMKLMNEIESEVAGEIVRVYVENGQPVEYGQSLFAIKPTYKK